MITNDVVDTTKYGRSDLDRLVRERGLRRFSYFFVSGEDEYFPDGTETASGYVLNEDGQVYAFWYEWDAEHGVSVLGKWRPAKPRDQWLESREYREARAAVGLPATH